MPSAPAPCYERSDAEPRLIAALAAGVAAFLLHTPLVLAVIYPLALRQPVTRLSFGVFSAPRLQVEPVRDRAAQRQAEDQRLSTYGWVDPDHQVLHLPIDRALSLTQQRGLPGWKKQ